MKTLYIEAIQKLKSKPNIKPLLNLPKTLHIIYSIQYKKLAEELKSELEKNKFKIVKIEQILGCSKLKPKAPLLYIGTGRFHPLNISLTTNKPVYIYNGKLDKITETELKKHKQKQRAKLIRFYNSDKIGILISTKPGQYNLKQAEKLKSKFKNKKSYLFLADTIDTAEFENFQLPIYINTACPTLRHPQIINLRELEI